MPKKTRTSGENEGEPDDDDVVDGEAELVTEQAELPAGVEEVNDEGETVNPGAAEDTAPPAPQLAFPPHDSSDTMTRRSATIVVALVVAALDRRRPHDRAVVAAAPEAHARPRPPGRPRDHEAGRAAQGPRPDQGGPRPLGLDHARPRRPPRRLRARDPHAGRRPDHDPAAGGQGSGDRREDHRQDRPARALRPRGEPGAAVDRRAPAAGCRRARSTTCSRASRRWPPRVRPSSTGSSTSRRSSSPGPSRRRRRRSPSSAARCRRATSSSRCRREPWSSPAASARSSAPASSRRTRRRTRTTCSSTRRRTSPR